MENHAVENSSGKGSAESAPPNIDFIDKEADVSDFSVFDLPGLFALWCLAFIVFLQFFTRYVLNDSIAWTEEIARYTLILVAFLGAISVTKKGTHIFLEFFYRYLSPAAGKWLSIAMEVICLVYYGYLAILAVELAQKTRTKMASVEIPKSLLYWSVAGALALMTLFTTVWLLRKFKQSPADLLRDLEERSLHDVPD
ncbi:TRAP transporter small permease [Cognatishimia maritima]|uniref:TRAP transporter small permease protein n=1 Tax=Cognatishimia maritima TaxID=870908 RepID=A0A1M5LAJ6_9RHOB|nr:TRAP transporter small permease [Cognatishimia maritima]SHG61965.1 TRAP-type C4-dicarboxylate transport system, small permease component [Cognatishimia maritima]